MIEVIPMVFLFSLSDFTIKEYAIILGVVIVVVAILAVFINKGKYAARFKNFYKKMDKAITKKYNGNILAEEIIKSYAIDQTNTFKSMRSKGRRKVTKYLEYYTKNLPELVLLKSFVSTDKNKSELVILFLDEMDKVVYRWDKRRKVKGMVKAINKYQMLTSLVGYLFELPLHIFEGASYRFTNHDNDFSLSYDIVKNVKHVKRKQKPVKMTKAELKAQAKVEKAKAKKEKKRR